MFNRYFGLQHYANLGLDFGKSDNWRTFYADLTYNLDLLINTYAGDTVGTGLILGAGFGFKSSTFALAGEKQSTKTFNFQTKINIGARLFFKHRYALDLLLRIPLLKTQTGYYFSNGEFLKYKDYFTLGINFTLGCF